MHPCIDCEGDCDCDQEDLMYESTPDDCTGCGCDEEDEYAYDDDFDY